MKAPEHLRHKPIIAVNNYENIDRIDANPTDARALSIGQAQYDKDEISVKVWRHTGNKWSRQSEEIPIHRALDLSILAITAISIETNSKLPLTSLNEEIVIVDRVHEIKDYYKDNKKVLLPRLEELRKILNTFLDKEE